MEMGLAPGLRGHRSGGPTDLSEAAASQLDASIPYSNPGMATEKALKNK